MTKADKILLAVVLAAAFVLLFLFEMNRAPGSHAVLSCGGRTLMNISLSQTEPRYYLVLYGDSVSVRTLSTDAWNEEMEALLTGSGASDSGSSASADAEAAASDSVTAGAAGSTVEYNLFSCENGEIQMIQSSCPDLICVHHRPVSRAGENIVCLPHELVIEIIGAQENELDGVVY